MENGTYTHEFAELSDSLEKFVQIVKSKKSSLLATDEWTVKEVLCHLVFWHENYAANYQALSENQEPPLLVGPGYKLNPDGVSSLRKNSIQSLIDRLLKAQKSLYRSIIEKKVPQMTYKKDGRVYKTSEFLHAISGHFITHAKHIKRAK